MNVYSQVITNETQRLWGSDTGAYIAVITGHFDLMGCRRVERAWRQA
jgi:hypothetical protein